MLNPSRAVVMSVLCLVVLFASLCPPINLDYNLDWLRCDFRKISDYLSCVNWDTEFLGCDVRQCYSTLSQYYQMYLRLLFLLKIIVPLNRHGQGLVVQLGGNINS